MAGVFSGEELVARWRIATSAQRMADEYAALALSLFALAGLRVDALDGVIVASVVPAARAAVAEATRQHAGIEPMVVAPPLKLGIEVRYTPPSGVGADRIANAVAAIQRYGRPAIVVDFGTGTNFDVVDAAGRYIGGAIAPGIEISVGALVASTSLLPQVPLVAPEFAVGQSTVAALQSGIIFGYAGLVDGLVGRISDELEGAPVVIATGGLASVVAPHTRSVQQVDVDLTLHGLALIYRNNQSADADSSTS